MTDNYNILPGLEEGEMLQPEIEPDGAAITRHYFEEMRYVAQVDDQCYCCACGAAFVELSNFVKHVREENE